MEVKAISPVPFSIQGYTIKLICVVFPLKIRSITGKVIEVIAHHKMTISELKSEIEKIDKSPIDTQRIICKGKQLEDDKTLDYYNINEKSIVHICLRIRAGMFLET
jgi:hypothetical protein